MTTFYFLNNCHKLFKKNEILIIYRRFTIGTLYNIKHGLSNII